MDNKEKSKVGKTSICFDCANALGNCPWSKIDPETGRVAFDAVPGWEIEDARRVEVRKGKPVNIDGIRVVKCPQFVKDKRSGHVTVSELSALAEKEFLEDPMAFLKKYERFY